jgi:hypothetical protein
MSTIHIEEYRPLTYYFQAKWTPRSGQNASWADESAIALSCVVGDPFPYGVEANKKAIETMVQFAVEQKIISKSFSVEELFVPKTLNLPD